MTKRINIIVDGKNKRFTLFYLNFKYKFSSNQSLTMDYFSLFISRYSWWEILVKIYNIWLLPEDHGWLPHKIFVLVVFYSIFAYMLKNIVNVPVLYFNFPTDKACKHPSWRYCWWKSQTDTWSHLDNHSPLPGKLLHNNVCFMMKPFSSIVVYLIKLFHSP